MKENNIERTLAVALAKSSALSAGKSGAQSYLPKTSAELGSWAPHTWVVDAIMAAGMLSGKLKIDKLDGFKAIKFYDEGQSYQLLGLSDGVVVDAYPAAAELLGVQLEVEDNIAFIKPDEDWVELGYTIKQVIEFPS